MSETRAYAAPTLSSFDEVVSQRKRYVIAARSGVQMASEAHRSRMADVQGLLRSLEAPFESLEETHDDKVAFLNEEEVSRLADQPGVIVEEDLQCHLLKDPVLQPFSPMSYSRGRSVSVQTMDVETGEPVPFATVYLFADWEARVGYKVKTDQRGRGVVEVAPSHRVFEVVAAYPRWGYWNRRQEGVPASSVVSIGLRPLTVSNGARWGIELTKAPESTGQGVRVGIIDSGVWRDHPNLTPAGGRSFVGGSPAGEWWRDEDGHGTHVARVVAARVHNAEGIDGYAPDAGVYAYRVFGGPDGGGFFSMINRAIRRAVADGCDLINLSLGGPPSASMRAKLEMAAEEGVLCLAAAGNSAASVEYPAAFDEVMAVSAIGMFGSYPDDSLHVMEESTRVSSDRRLYAARFSCHGSEVAVTMPGVAILSTVPPEGFAAWNGTSMACPHAVGLAAAWLSAEKDILGMQRDATRTEAIRKMLLKKADDLGLQPAYQGKGLLRGG